MSSPATAALQRLIRAGFDADVLLDPAGERACDYYRRDHRDRGVREVVLVFSGDRARAYRHRVALPVVQPLGAPQAELLIPEADTVTVVHALLARPLP